MSEFQQMLAEYGLIWVNYNKKEPEHIFKLYKKFTKEITRGRLKNERHARKLAKQAMAVYFKNEGYFEIESEHHFLEKVGFYETKLKMPKEALTGMKLHFLEPEREVFQLRYSIHFPKNGIDEQDMEKLFPELKLKKIFQQKIIEDVYYQKTEEAFKRINELLKDAVMFKQIRNRLLPIVKMETEKKNKMLPKRV